MKWLLIFLLALSVSLTVFPGAHAQEPLNFEFLSGIPIMEGLEEDLDQRVVFDKVEGRIAMAEFGGHVSSDEVVTFYKETLTHLGWEIEGETIENLGTTWVGFIKENELLQITIKSRRPLRVRIELGPLS